MFIPVDFSTQYRSLFIFLYFCKYKVMRIFYLNLLFVIYRKAIYIVVDWNTDTLTQGLISESTRSYGFHLVLFEQRRLLI